MAKLTLGELREMFGPTMPMEAVLLLQDESLGINELRAKLGRMATTPKGLSVRALNIYSHHVAEAIRSDEFDKFSTEEKAMEKVIEFVIQQCCPAKG